MAEKVLFVASSLMLIAVAAGLGFGLFAQSSLTGFFAGSKEDVSLKIENLYELINPTVDVTVEKIEETNGMYKVLFKSVDVSGVATFREAYVTKDGELLTESMVIVSQSINQITRLKDFVSCLQDRNLAIFGVLNDTPTALQFNILGGAYATRLYRSCDGSQNQQCVDAGITQVPTTVYEGRGYAGVQPFAFFQNLTGCVL